MTKYEIILYWSNEDQAFIAEVPELAGCAADGLTRQEALANTETIIAERLGTARALGRPIPEPKGCAVQPPAIRRMPDGTPSIQTKQSHGSCEFRGPDAVPANPYKHRRRHACLQSGRERSLA